MPRLNDFTIEIETGAKELMEPVRFTFNSHEMTFDDFSGETKGNKTFIATSPTLDSYAHSMTLLGPKEGEWEVKKFSISYRVEDDEPYTLSFGPLCLNSKNQVNIWHEKALETFDV